MSVKVKQKVTRATKKVKYFSCRLELQNVLLHLSMNSEKQKNNILNFKVSEHLKEAIIKGAQRKGLTPSQFVREVVKKYIKYKEPEIV